MNIRDDRELVFARIKKALQTKAPKHSTHANETGVSNTPPPAGATSASEADAKAYEADAKAPAFRNELPIINNGHGTAEFRNWMPAVGATWEEQTALFARNAADLKAEFHVCENETEAHAKLVELARELGWTRVASHQGELTDKALARLGLPVTATDGGYAVDEMEACNAAITECELLVAQTGSVLVTPNSSGGRALSVLPPHHVVLARRSQMLPDLTAAFQHIQEKYAAAYPSMISFVTGPSRTGDIERILVLGAHGPKRLTIYCF